MLWVELSILYKRGRQEDLNHRNNDRHPPKTDIFNEKLKKMKRIISKRKSNKVLIYPVVITYIYIYMYIHTHTHTTHIYILF